MEILHVQSTAMLNNGVFMPRLGLGVWKVTDDSELQQAIAWALEAGYRLIDTAKIYGNEEGVGKAIASASIAREDLFVTTKLWNTDQGYETARVAIEESLARLGLTYVDLYLVHWPSKDKGTRQESWKAMEEILQNGKARAIGVSNYTVEHLQEMKAYANVVPAVNQIELHPFWYQEDILTYCKSEGIVVEAYSPLARASRLSDPTIVEIAEKYHKTPAQILIRWSLQLGCVVIPKSVRHERIYENKDVFDFELSDADMEALCSLNQGASVL